MILYDMNIKGVLLMLFFKNRIEYIHILEMILSLIKILRELMQMNVMCL